MQENRRLKANRSSIARERIPVGIFIRVSKSNMDFSRQESELRAIADRSNYNIVVVIAAKESATKLKNEDREGVKKLQEVVEAGKIKKLLTNEVSRIGRNTIENLKILQYLTEKKVSIFSQDMGLETLQSDGKLSMAAEILFTVYSSTARQETERLRSRILSGLEEARRKGKKLGRKKGSCLSEDQILKKYSKVAADLKSKISIRKIARIHSINPSTVMRIKKVLERRSYEGK